MNPFRWKSEHLVAGLMLAIVGSILGVWVGYAFTAISAGSQGATSFRYWFSVAELWFDWALLGALMGLMMTYAIVLLRADAKG